MGSGEIFVYKLHTSFDGCNVLARPLQHFCTKPNCMGDEVRRLWCSYVLRVSGKSHKFTHNYTPVCVMPDAGRVAPISACVLGQRISGNLRPG